MENFSCGEDIFASSNTVIQKAKTKDGNLNVIIKKPRNIFPNQHLIESYKKDYSLTKMLHQQNP
eukprot:gene12841-7190_t